MSHDHEELILTAYKASKYDDLFMGFVERMILLILLLSTISNIQR
jgi:hypothetical protein